MLFSGGPIDGRVIAWSRNLASRIRLPADPDSWPPSGARLQEHRYVREDTPKLYIPADLAITYRYEGTR